MVSPEATVWSGQATYVLARTPEGELGILADHEPLMGALGTGPVEIEAETEGRIIIGVHGGFIQVLDPQETLITDRARITEDHEAAKEIAAELAELEEEAEEEFAGSSPEAGE